MSNRYTDTSRRKSYVSGLYSAQVSAVAASEADDPMSCYLRWSFRLFFHLHPQPFYELMYLDLDCSATVMAGSGSHMLRKALCLVSRIEFRDDPQVPEKDRTAPHGSRITLHTSGQDMGTAVSQPCFFVSYKNATKRIACDISSVARRCCHPACPHPTISKLEASEHKHEGQYQLVVFTILAVS